MTERTLLVPVFVDGLCLSYGRSVNGPLVDFRALPYVERTEAGPIDVHSDTPWLGAFTARRPMSGCDTWLPAGTHLHWALPDALTHARSRNGESEVLEFRPAPDRWLVARWRGSRLERRWLVESNYLWPHDTKWAEAHESQGVHPDGLVSYLLPPDKRTSGTPPWRFLGRRVDLPQGERPGDAGDERYLDRLTAVGYGEGHFAAYYPSCRSVFGLHDPDITTRDSNLRYQVAGWYSRPEDDPLRDSAAPADPEPWLAWLREALGWSAEPGPPATRTLCVATLLGSGLEGAEPAPAAVSVALAENHVESLAALVATKIAGHDAEKVERFLEGLLVADDPAEVTEDELQPRRFDATMGDPIWAVVLQTETGNGLPGPEALAQAPEPTLPDMVAWKLNLLNDARRTLTASASALAAARRQLHLDWCRLQFYKYPPFHAAADWSDALGGHDVDVVRCWLEEERLGPLQELEAAHAAALAAHEEAHTEAEKELKTHNDGAPETERWMLQEIQGPSYYTPTQPSVAVLGLAPTERHHTDGAGREDGTLGCAVTAQLDVESLTAASAEALAELSAHSPSEPDGPGRRATPRPHPLFLEWQAEVAPLREGNTVDPRRTTIDPGLVRHHFTLPEDGPELQFKGDHAVDTADARPIVGRGFMSRGAQALLLERLEPWLERRLRENPEITEGQKKLEYAREHRAEIRDHFPESDPARIALDAWDVLAGESVLTQSLAGFNEALLMLRPDCSLNVEEPLGFARDREFAERVRRAVNGQDRQTPDVGAPFLPIRTGAVGLSALHLVDTWGRPAELPVDSLVTSRRLRIESGLPVALPARIVQPSRLAVRWLDAVHDEQEMGAHPAASPICGWLVPDTLEGTVQVYDASGGVQGSVDADALWRIAPGPAGGAVRPADLPNPHLARVIDWMARRTPVEMAELVQGLETALENIAPALSRQQEARALLMGRPVAVVRAYVNLELQSPWATDQSVTLLNQTLSAYRRRAAAPRTARVSDTVLEWGLLDSQTEVRDAAVDPDAPSPTAGFEHVELPLRIGEHLRLGDGVLGYFVEQGDGSYRDDVLWTPQGRPDSSTPEHIRFREAADPVHLPHSLADPEVFVTILMDPEAALHVACGVLPAKSIRVPREQYERALRAIGVTFLTAPVLSPAQGLELPLPEVAGWSWSWLSQEGGRWQRLAHHATIPRALVDAAFPDLPLMWTALHQAGWLSEWPDHPDQARITDFTRRPELPPELAPSKAAIERVLEAGAHSITNPSTDARFAPGLMLREGWLQLSRE